MARIKDSSVREAVAAADIVEVVSGRTPLRRAGARYTGLCPFHEERTPSFSVAPQDKLYYCFGCGKGGDVISFVRETENLDFAEAVEWLAERFRVTLEYEESSPRIDAQRKHRERLLALLEQAAGFYERYLWESRLGEGARQYLRERKLEEPVCREYRLGLSPGGATLAQKAREGEFSQTELEDAGLVNRRGNDYFSDRLLFPLSDPRGRVIGFGARRMREDDPLRAKYVNSPEGELFHKAGVVYGLHLARAAVAKEDRAIVVEGYTDVLALHQVGLQPVVASMGTSLTERQLKELGRLTRRIFLCFDSDAAGEAATLRGMEIAHALDLQVRVVALPAGLDPADAAEGFEDLLRGAESYVKHRARLAIEGARDREEAFREVREVLSRFDDSPERQDAVSFAADRLDLPRETQAGLAPRARRASGGLSPKLLVSGFRLERMFLAACVLDPEGAAEYVTQLGDEHFDSEDHRRLRAELAGEVVAAGDDAALRAELWATAEQEGVSPASARGLFLELQERWIEREIAHLHTRPMTGEDERRHGELVQLQSKLRAAVTEQA
ncbi:MAG: DNA primase [Actinobacteria bacterium]|nr:DNA primase [Actinomycetota bacterium]